MVSKWIYATNDLRQDFAIMFSRFQTFDKGASLDFVSKVLIYFAFIWGPWAFGSTQPWSVRVLYCIGMLLGAISALRWLIKCWSSFYDRPLGRSQAFGNKYNNETWLKLALLSGTVLLLLYNLTALVNCRAECRLWSLEYRECFLWLPHSYCRQQTVSDLKFYIALAGFFWGVRDWLQSRGVYRDGMPERMQNLLWWMSLNGGVLAFVALLQHFTEQNRLLWLVEPGIIKNYKLQFGTFAYHANGAQYFNLIWPVSLSLWLYWQLRQAARCAVSRVVNKRRLTLLLSSVFLMILCPIISLSRGGVVVLILQMAAVAVILWISLRRIYLARWWGVLAGGLVALTLALTLEGSELVQRFQQPSGRHALHSVGWDMAADLQPFGCGLGAYSMLQRIYWPSTREDWTTYMHNDWLQALVELGWVGLVISLLPLIYIFIRHIISGGISLPWPVVTMIWVALLGVMLHASMDFPFHIKSILITFTLLCSLLSTISASSLASMRLLPFPHAPGGFKERTYKSCIHT